MKKFENPTTRPSINTYSDDAESLLDPSHCQKTPGLAEHAESIRKLSRRVIADVIEIGRRLSECKRLLGHGNWLPWLRQEFSWSERTARNFIAVYELSQSESANFADLAIDVSSLYLIAAPSTPERVRHELLGELSKGEALPHAEIKRSVEEAKETQRDCGKRRITMRDVKLGLSDMFELSSEARLKMLEKRPENLDLAIQDALTRQRWPAPYRELHDVLDAVETLKRHSMTKIIGVIPPEHFSAVMLRLESATSFLRKIEKKLTER